MIWVVIMRDSCYPVWAPTQIGIEHYISSNPHIICIEDMFGNVLWQRKPETIQ